MRICIDLDGVLCYTKKSDENYSDVLPIEGSIEAIQELKNEGHYIIIATSRHMKTCNGNVGQIIAKQGKTLIDWLEKHNIKYDELLFGKSLADFYIDDKAIHFTSWNNTLTELRQRMENK